MQICRRYSSVAKRRSILVCCNLTLPSLQVMSSSQLSVQEIIKRAGRLYDGKVALLKSDITKLEIHAIVNAANRSLLGGGGVDGAIHAAAGSELVKECETLGGCDTGEAKITKGYKLPCKNVIHTVGPIGENREKLSNCYANSLNLLLKHELRTIAFPCISTGIYGYPNEAAAHVALETTKNWLQTNKGNVDLIIFCLFMPVDVKIYKKLAKKYFPEVTDTDYTEKEMISEACGQAQSDAGTSKSPGLQPSAPTGGIHAINAETEMQKTCGQDGSQETEKCSYDANGTTSSTQEDLERSVFDPELTVLKAKFERLEKELVRKSILKDTEPWSCGDESFPGLTRIIYEDTTVEKVETPYIPGYLAYRESPLYVKKVQKVMKTPREPQIILLDGNGVLHPRRFGLACALGVACDVATIGVAKNLFQMKDEGIERNSHHDEMINNLKTGGSFDVCTNSGEVLGKALRTTNSSKKPVYVSIGHRCSLETATNIAKCCSRYRLPEPIRQADVRSREMLRTKFEADYASYYASKQDEAKKISSEAGRTEERTDLMAT